MATKRTRRRLLTTVRQDGSESERWFMNRGDAKAWAERAGASILNQRWHEDVMWRGVVPSPVGGQRERLFRRKSEAIAWERSQSLSEQQARGTMTPNHTRATDELLEPEEVAALLRKSARTLGAWRRAEYGVRGPNWVQVGGEIRYWRSDVLAWLDQQKVVSR